MMVLNLQKGMFDSVNGNSKVSCTFNDFAYPTNKYRFNYKEYIKNLPPIDEVYQKLMAAEYPTETIIDYLIGVYFPMRFFNVGKYKNIALSIGLIGTRGTGKTCGAVIIASCDYLLRGKPVWSNVPIHIKVKYKEAEKEFKSFDLAELDMLDITKDYGSGVAVYDEVNMEAAEGARYNSSANLQFSYAMQQIRKRHMDVIWTCQGWNWIDNRLRWQTDFVVSCRDATMDTKYYRPGTIGANSVWRIHDLSGLSGAFDYDFQLKHRYLTDYVIGTHIVYMRPWWNAYTTDQLLGQQNYIEAYKKRKDEKKREENDILPEGSKWSTITELLEWMEKFDEVLCDEVWQQIKVNGNLKSIQIKVGHRIDKTKWNKITDRYNNATRWVKVE